tara:strand:+ start:968 stop:2125 length:1158 start_codon:yes stop_codon:yes gene_type:complete
MIFSDKYIDYSSKTRKELRQALILFSLLSNRLIVKIGNYLLKITLKLHLPVLFIIKKTIFKHFCGGENISESRKKINDLGAHNIQTILDYSVEGKNDVKSLENTYKEILRNLDEANKNSLIPFSVFKFTGLARFDLLKKINQKKQLNQTEQDELKILKKRLNDICQKAQNINIPILIDAEESWIQDAVDKLTEELMMKYNKSEVIVFNTIQLYRWDKLEYIKDLHNQAKKQKFKLGLKLVRGAYMEKERMWSKKNNEKCVIHQTKENCDQDYNSAVKYCINNIADMGLCFGTHNEHSTALILQLMKQKGIENNDKKIYFSQLLGMSDNISFYLAHFNYNVAKYVPYGPIREVIPYLIRRVEENSAITSQTKSETKRLKKALRQKT